MRQSPVWEWMRAAITVRMHSLSSRRGWWRVRSDWRPGLVPIPFSKSSALSAAAFLSTASVCQRTGASADTSSFFQPVTISPVTIVPQRRRSSVRLLAVSASNPLACRMAAVFCPVRMECVAQNAVGDTGESPIGADVRTVVVWSGVVLSGRADLLSAAGKSTFDGPTFAGALSSARGVVRGWRMYGRDQVAVRQGSAAIPEPDLRVWTRVIA